MQTERDIIYTLLNTVRSGEFNLDEPLTERLLRNFLKTHRAKHIAKYYNQGQLINDECFQWIEGLQFTAVNSEWVCELPPIVPFPKNYGVNFYKLGYPIQVTSASQWRNNQYSTINSYQPAIKIINNKATLYLGKLNQTENFDDDFTNSRLNVTVRTLNTESSGGTITLDSKMVLKNPDDATGYDWTTDVYPFPSELIDQLINSVTARELNVFLKTSSDDTGNKFSNENKNPQTEEF